jgi:uncharacterized protein
MLPTIKAVSSRHEPPARLKLCATMRGLWCMEFATPAFTKKDFKNMAISLYDVTVASNLQIARATTGVLEKGMAHCKEGGTDSAELVAMRLYPDMLPLAFQIYSVRHHSVGAIEGCKAGVFKPPGGVWAELDYAGLQKVAADTVADLEKFTAAEINALEGRDVVFEIRDMKMPFTAENFLMSFSLPNFYFHATTAYDILRSKGVKLGKRDYSGMPRMKK